MHQPENRYLLSLLVKAYNRPILDYYYFPEVIYVGRQKMDREDFEYLLAEGLIGEYKHDAFGRFYTLTKKAEELLFLNIAAKAARKKRPSISVPTVQGRLCFS